ncbi:MAG: GlxA family transcriptional regulator [Gammaproteobacteria bacterium]|nr:GlxA family transcriptional regulator [Gammaproteobacteria bacterium]
MKLFQPTTRPLDVCLLILSGSSLMTVASVLDTMRACNRIAKQKLFNWKLISIDGKAIRLSCGLSISADSSLEDINGGDLLMIIAGLNQDPRISSKTYRRIHFLYRHYQFLAGVEAGSWLLARAGLLTDKKATTHWEDFEEFCTKFPDIEMRTDRFVIDGKIITTGGASPSFDFMLYLIRKRYGYPLSLDVASIFIYDGTHKPDDAQPSISLGMLETYDQRVATVIRIMEQHLDEPMSIIQLAKEVGLSIRRLENLFSQTLNTSPCHYYLHLRLQAARRMVVDTRLSIQEIAIRTGFTSLSSFSRRFKQHFGNKASAFRC